MLFGIFRRDKNRLLIDKLHGEIVAGSRRPALFSDYGVPDTLEGRFESLTLHAALTLRRFNQLPAPAPELAQELTDGVFRFLDANLREMGVGDVTVPKRIKIMAEAFLGRSGAYVEALSGSDEMLEAVLVKNVFAGQGGDAPRLARYVRRVEAGLAAASFDQLQSQPLPFPDPLAVV
jgi:cytochrome b pre-mRNA-processing protein 3